MNTSEILIKAKALIEKPERWTQGKYKVFRNGEPCYCAEGATRAVNGVVDGEDDSALSINADWDALYEAEQVFRDANGQYMISLNDSSTHAEVMEAFDKAIALAKQQEAQCA